MAHHESIDLPFRLTEAHCTAPWLMNCKRRGYVLNKYRPAHPDATTSTNLERTLFAPPSFSVDILSIYAFFTSIPDTSIKWRNPSSPSPEPPSPNALVCASGTLGTGIHYSCVTFRPTTGLYLIMIFWIFFLPMPGRECAAGCDAPPSNTLVLTKALFRLRCGIMGIAPMAQRHLLHVWTR